MHTWLKRWNKGKPSSPPPAQADCPSLKENFWNQFLFYPHYALLQSIFYSNIKTTKHQYLRLFKSISVYSFGTEGLTRQDFEAYVPTIQSHCRALNDLGSLNTGWLVGPSSVIIHLKSYLFICLEDSNILHFANLCNIFLWENAIETMS